MVRPSGDIRVAVLDDQRLVAEALSCALNGDGIAVVVTTWSWGDLMAHLETPVDVAVVDLRLKDGVFVSTKMRTLDALQVATIVTSASPDSSAVVAALHAGALGFVPKSASIADLRAAIIAAYAGDLPRREPTAVATTAPDPGLGRQEERALGLYASGKSIREVAHEMETTEETVKSYIKRGRRKFRDIGVDISTRILLRRYAAREGWLGQD